MKNRHAFLQSKFIAILIRTFLFSNQTNSILEADMGFIDAIGLRNILSTPTD
jgi:hypothetical protein